MAAKTSLVAVLAALISSSVAAQQTGSGDLSASGQDSRFSSGVNTTLTISDNINLSPNDGTSGSTIEIGPYIRYDVNRPRLQADLFYGLRYFDTTGRLGSEGLRHDVRSKLNAALWQDTFWLSGQAIVTEAVNDPINAGTVDASRQSGGRTTVQRYSIAPYFSDFLGDRDTAYTVGYGASYGKNSSRNEAQITQRIIGNLTRDRRVRGIGWAFDSEFTKSAFESSDATYNTTRFIAEALVRPNGKFRLGVGVQYDRISAVRDEQDNDSGFSPTVSALWSPNERTNLSARVSNPYYGSTASARLAYQPGRWALGVDYSYGLTDNFSGALTQADVSESLATGERPGAQSAVVSRLLEEGIFPAFGTTITDGFVLSAISRTRRLGVNLGWTGKRNSFGVLASRVQSESQLLEVDLPVSVGSPRQLEQTTLAFIYSRNLDRRTRAGLRLSTTRSRSQDQANASRLDIASVYWERQATKSVDVRVAYRFANQRATEGQANTYQEHAIVLGVNYRFQ
ncbi:MAG: TIGR03016 family PEP-CTERM system-associated outer membrane protein [Burkholderiaceae bacterium]